MELNSTTDFYSSFNKEIERVRSLSASEIAVDERYWSVLRNAYLTEDKFINLNNGGVNPQPLPVREAVVNYYNIANQGPTYYMWKVLEARREPLRQKLAAFINADPSEVAITRNTTESLDVVINGITLNKGDEVVLSRYDYPNMIYAWKQREKREGIKLTWIELDLSEEEPDRIIEKYIRHFTSRTKVLLIPHIVNWTGQLLPVKEILSAARERRIQTILDAAHSFATLDIDIKDLDPDYMGTSLHKWLGAPFGTGLLYVRKDRIRELWPLFANETPESDDIRKFEWQGTRCFPLEFAIEDALELHLKIGTANKRARLNYLKDYLVEKVSKLPGVHIISPENPLMSSNLVTFSVDQMEPAVLETRLLEKGITVAAFSWEDLKGIRLTPNTYTTSEELDKFFAIFSSILEEASD